MSAKIWALVMTALAVIYVVLLGQKAVLLLLEDNWVAKAMGAALIFLPLVAAWAILTEVKFGIDAERVPCLVRRIVAAEADWRGFHIFAGSQALDAAAIKAVQRAGRLPKAPRGLGAGQVTFTLPISFKP